MLDDKKKTCHICSVINLNEPHRRWIVSDKLSSKWFLEFGKFVCISGQVNLAKFTWPDPELKCEL